MTRNIKPTQPTMPDFDAYIEEIWDIWETKALTNQGPKVQKLQEAMRGYMGCGHVDAFVNGHSALLLAIRALNMQGEALTSPFTFVSTTNAIVQNGLVPVFCDIDDSYNIDVRKLEGQINEKTCAIIVPHIFGIPCDVEGIREIAEKHRLKVIYDGAQAFGTRVGGRNIGTFGDVTMFSLHAVKICHSIEGGLLAYSDGSLREQFELYRNFGISYLEDKNDVTVCGINAKMNEFQAAMGLLGLAIVDREIATRKGLAQRYIERLAGIEGVTAYPYEDGIDYNYAYFPVRVNKRAFGMGRDELFLRLKGRGIVTRKLYDTLCCDYSYFKAKGYRTDVSHAREIAGEALDLPLYGALLPEEVEYVCDAIAALQKEGGNG